MNRCRKSGITVFLLLLVLITSCSKINVAKPEGFAEIKERDYYRAVSPEGVMYSVRVARNEPQMNLDFWAKALKNHLAKEGYKVLAEDGESFKTGDKEGILYEWGVPYGNEDYIYLTAIVVSGKTIAIAEAGGEHTDYRDYREALIDSLQSLTIR
jgi:hypothetical protein